MIKFHFSETTLTLYGLLFDTCVGHFSRGHSSSSRYINSATVIRQLVQLLALASRILQLLLNHEDLL